MPYVPIHGVGPQPGGGGGLYVPDMQNNREGPQARETPKFLDGQSYGERLAKNAFRMPATSGSKKDSNRAITPAVEAVRVQLGSPGQAAAPPSYPTRTWAEPPQTKKKKISCLYACRVALVLSNSLQLYRLWPARLLCQRVSPGKNTGAY